MSTKDNFNNTPGAYEHSLTNTTNHKQYDNLPLQASNQNQNIDSTIDQLLSNDFVTTNQSTIEVNTTNTITTENNFIHNPERNRTAARRARAQQRPQQHHQQQTSQQLLASPWHLLLNQPVQFRPFQQFQPRRRQQLNQAQRQQHPQQQRQRTEPRRYRRYRQWQERLNQRSLDRQSQTRQTYYKDRTNTTNHKQYDNLPLQASDQNQNIDSTIDQLLSNDFVTTNQSTIELSTTNTITTENNFIHNPERNQTAARRARPQQHHQQQTSQQLLASPWHPLLNQPVQFRPFQQFQPRRRQQLNQAQRQQHPQQQRQRTEPRRYRRYRQWQERLNQRSLDRQFQTRQTYYRDRYVDYDSDDHLSIEDMHDELLEGYEWEQMDEKTKWEQEHIKDIERLATQDILMITQDEIDQIQQIETAKQITENEKKERNIHLLNQNDLFEQLQFIQLQLRQP
ncbi:unnamed protein product [Rotaria sordida]|uniref:Uncharacterized protein n=1 Tax=Rotaria sordida TaxID=392033 RepID=A0A815I180_9BILA|nr:unnamed protein product [Rotaria sordida]